MKTIEYTANGIALADQDCEQTARDFLSTKGEINISVSNSIFIYAVRALICEGFIPHTEVKFLFQGETLLPNKDGRMENWPQGFCDHADHLLSRLLRGRST